MVVRINPLRCARGVLPLQSSTNNGIAALFNPDGTRLLVVWNVIPAPTFSGVYNVSVLNSRLTNQNAGNVSPVVTGEPAPPGQIDWDDLATLPPPDYYLTLVTGLESGVILTKPLAVIRPGWSLAVFGPGAPGEGIAAGFYWEWIFPEDLYSRSAGDSALVI